MQEQIICSAIWYDDTEKYAHQPSNITSGFIVAGMRHHNCYMTIYCLRGIDKSFQSLEKEQGFLTNLNRFVDRKEGLLIARSANQLLDSEPIRGDELFSENLY